MRDVASRGCSVDHRSLPWRGAASGASPADGPPPPDASHAVEARPFRHARPLIFFFATPEAACDFADVIRGWPGPRPLVGRILRGRIAEGCPRWIGEGPTALAVEEIAPEDGRPWC